MAGVGSVWNANNWHWEEKNYKQWGNNRLQELILSLSLQDQGYQIVFPEVSKLSGEASVNIRKGKSILFFEFEIEGTWKASKENSNIEGKFKILEFNQEELEDFELEATTTDTSEDSNKIRYFLQTKAKKEISKAFKQFYNEFKELESNSAKLENDKKRRIEEEEKRKIAVVEKSDEQERILKEAKEREANLRLEAEKLRKEEEVKGTGSVWNTNSYFWEEKSVSWAAERIKTLINGKKVPILNGEILITVNEVLGDSSVSIRKAKKIVTYCHELKLKWEGKIQELEANGEIHMPDISEDTSFDMIITFATNNPGQEVFKNFIETEVKNEIIQNIQIFVNELKEV
jgi:activator of HSP90 ATPase